MPKPTTFSIERAFLEETDVLDLHFAVLEAVVRFMEECPCPDTMKLTAALRVSFDLVCQRYYNVPQANNTL